MAHIKLTLMSMITLLVLGVYLVTIRNGTEESGDISNKHDQNTYKYNAEQTNEQLPHSSSFVTEMEKGMTDDHAKYSIDTVARMVDYLHVVNSDTIEINRIIELLNSSNEAFDYVTQWYIETKDSNIKQMLSSLLAHCSHPDKIDFAIELSRSDTSGDRQRAYQLLNQSELLETPEAQTILLDAIYKEQNNELLSQLLLTMPYPNAKYEPQLLAMTLARLQDLSFQENESLAASALITLARLDPNEQTLSLLTSQLHHHSEIMQLAAIKGLHNYEKPSNELMEQLTTMRDTSTTAALNNAVNNLLIAFGDYSMAPTVSFVDN